MPNEFVARNGIIALNNSQITGSLNVSQGITGSLFGTSSWSNNAATSSYILNAVSSSFAATASNVQGGSTSYIPLWNTATRLSSSVMYQSGSSIGINTVSPQSSLHVYRAITGGGTERTSPLDVLTLESENTDSVEYDGFGQAIVFRGSTYNNTIQRTLGKIIHQINDNSTLTNRGTSLNIQLSTSSYGTTLESRLYIRHDGNIGIGTTLPDSNLQVGSISTSGNRTIRITDSGYGILLSGGGGGASNYIKSLGVTIPLYFLAGNNNDANYIFSSTGNVGIGTTTPNAKLDVNGNAIITGSLTVTGNITAQTLIVQTVTSSISFVTGSTRFGSTLSNTHQFTGSILATGSLVVDGNVGIGTTSPTAKLHAIGNIKLEQTTNASSTITLNPNSATIGTGYQWNIVAANSAASYAFQINEGTTNYFHIRNSAGSNGGFVGIGTASPTAKLEVSGNLLLSNNTGVIGIGNNTALNPYLQGDASNTLYIGTSGSARIAVLTSGNVGIGTTSPVTPLHISRDGGGSTIRLLRIDNSNVTNSQNLYLDMNTSKDILWSQGSSGGGTFWDTGTRGYGFSINTNRIVTFDQNGNVGVGTTSPTAKLHVTGSTGGIFEVDGVNSINALYVSASGNVGINTITPTEKLTVRGNGAKIRIESESNPSAYFATMQVNWDASNPFVLNSQGFDILGSKTNISNVSDRTTYLSSYYDLSLHAGATTTPSSSNARLYISSSGNVGIGTTTPNAKLDVNGNVAITGSIHMGQARIANTGSNVLINNYTLSNYAPHAPLSVSGSIISSNNSSVLIDTTTVNSKIKMGYGNSNNFPDNYAGFYVDGNRSLQVAANNAEQFIFGWNGNFAAVGVAGIPATPPARFYAIGAGTTNSTKTLQLTDSNTKDLFVVYDDGTTQVSGSLQVSGSIVSYVRYNTQTTNYTIALSDVSKIVEINSGSLSVVTVPSSSVVNFPIGSQITVAGYGAGQVSFTTGSSGVNIRSAGNRLRLLQQYSFATLTKRGADEWYLFGDLTV
jgi:hypothetical protein